MTRDLADVETGEALKSYRNLPLSFIPNEGQADQRVRYYAHGSGHRFSFTREEAVFSFIKPVSTSRGSGASDGEKDKSLTLALRFLGANPNVVVEGDRPAVGRVNYFIGADPARWRTNLPTYEEVRYRELWPGVDAVFRGGAGRIKYEFHVAAGVPIDRIRLAYLGAKGLSLDRKGNLSIETALGTLTDQRPISFQVIDGQRVEVESRYELRRGATGEKRYGFALAGGDPRYPLVIDPGLDYSTYLGGTSWDAGESIAVDAVGSAYITGLTQSADFPVTSGAFDITFNFPSSFGIDSGVDAFVTKLNAGGSAVLYSTFLGGTSSDEAFSIAVDAFGNAYVTGATRSADFPTTVGAFDTTFNGFIDPIDDFITHTDTFVTKLDAAGSALLYSTYLGLGGGKGIAVDGSGNAYVTGGASADFPTTVGAFATTFRAGGDGFVTKLNAAGAALVYSTYLGGGAPAAIAVDWSGNAYVTGVTGYSDFATAGAFDTTLGAHGDGFVAKFSADGSARPYAAYLGGMGTDFGHGVAVDASGNAYVTGTTQSEDFPTTAAAFDRTFDCCVAAFVTKVNAGGSALLYSTYLGGPRTAGSGIAVDASLNAYVTGLTQSADFPTTPGAFDTTGNGNFNSDAFVTKLNAAGSSLLYSTFLGGKNRDVANAIALDGWGNAYVTGETMAVGLAGAQSNDFPTTPGAHDTTANGSNDAFVAKVVPSPSATEGKVTGGGSIEATGDIASFGFNVQLRTSTGPVTGQLHFSNHATGENVQSVEFSTLTIEGDRATFSGTCTNNGDPCTFTVTVQDSAEPGRTDSFQIEGIGITPAGGSLRSGNIQIH